jgi:phosphoribosylamine---glycine ligase
VAIFTLFQDFMNILLLGSGGREHAFAWKMAKSPRCSKLYVAPGNAGTALEAENVAIAVDDFEAIGAFCVEKKIELVVVGPEVPLVKGIRDYFEFRSELKSILLVGPGKLGAHLEGSKDFSKQFMLRNGVPTAAAKTFFATQYKEAAHYIDLSLPPIVLKADGLAAGKGVIITSDKEEAKRTIREMLEEKKFGEASSKVLIEQFLDGIECSVFVLTDGNDYVILPEAKDYKRIGDGDTGPNTGGMGSVSPVVFADAAFMKKVEDKVVKPTIAGLKKENIPYKGFIFIGLMNVKGEPYVIEYNARMGDPETQSVLTRIKSDLVELLCTCAMGNMKDISIDVDANFALTIVMASGGYPDSFQKGYAIKGADAAHPAKVFHAGTKTLNGILVNDGGRVFGITGIGATLKEAQENAYAAANAIHWSGAYFRKDIGNDVLNLDKNWYGR